MSRHIAETFELRGYAVRIIADTDAEAPNNTEPDLFLVTTNNRYFCPDVPCSPHTSFDIGMVGAGEHDGEYFRFPLYMCQHSGTALSLTPLSCPWDSGQVGFVLVNRRDWRNDEDKARESAESYVETWNQYLSGDVYGFEIEDSDGNKIDSCWGLYGLDYAISEAKDNVPDEPCLHGGEGEDEAHEETLL